MLAELDLFARYAPVVSTLVAAISAFYSAKSAGRNLLAFEASIIRDANKSYATAEFLEHLRVLRAWLDAKAAEPELQFLELLREKEARAVRTDAARRAVKYFFEDFARLGRAGYLRRRAVRQVCSLAGIDLYFDAAIPLTKELHPAMDLQAHDYLRDLRFRRQRDIRSLTRAEVALNTAA